MAQDMVQWLYDLQHFGVKLGLDNIRSLLELLDHPERAFRSVHIAGTNGKGSVAAMVDSMLGASGVSSGLFTSPHLVRPNERIRVGGQDIPDAELQAGLERIRTTIEGALADGRIEVHPSFFEVVTATALQQYRDHGVEAAVLEVGLGGRLDATNAVQADVAVVVSIGLDHVKTLGGTLDLIAGEKAGIVKPGQPVISGVVQQVALNALRRVCRERGADLIDARSTARLVHEEDGRFDLRTPDRLYDGLTLSLPGRHQISNTQVALLAFERIMERLGRTPDADRVREGLSGVRWAGRLQWLEPPDAPARMLVDGAHNPAGILALSRYLRAADLPPRPVLLFGATSGKELGELLDPLGDLVDGVVLARPPVERGLDPAELAPLVPPEAGAVEIAENAADAVDRACRLAGSDRYVLVTGSLYLVGEVLGVLTRDDGPGPVAM